MKKNLNNAYWLLRKHKYKIIIYYYIKYNNII